jgi:hypothetical protein
MIIIPEIETVVILVPRTGSGSLRLAIAEKYPRSMAIYRHMEADGVPLGYDRWRKVGVVRHPIERLWSLYKFMRDYHSHAHDPGYVAALRGSCRLPFSDWIVDNEIVFTSPYDRGNKDRFFPYHALRHPIPENRKSQFFYLRPDLGTKVYRYDKVQQLHGELGVAPERVHNATSIDNWPMLSTKTHRYIDSVFAWDMAQFVDAG